MDIGLVEQDKEMDRLRTKIDDFHLHKFATDQWSIRIDISDFGVEKAHSAALKMSLLLRYRYVDKRNVADELDLNIDFAPTDDGLDRLAETSHTILGRNENVVPLGTKQRSR